MKALTKSFTTAAFQYKASLSLAVRGVEPNPQSKGTGLATLSAKETLPGLGIVLISPTCSPTSDLLIAPAQLEMRCLHQLSQKWLELQGVFERIVARWVSDRGSERNATAILLKGAIVSEQILRCWCNELSPNNKQPPEPLWRPRRISPRYSSPWVLLPHRTTRSTQPMVRLCPYEWHTRRMRDCTHWEPLDCSVRLSPL